MKNPLIPICAAILATALAVRAAAAGSPKAPARPTGDYATDLAVVVEAQGQALEQARQSLEKAPAGAARAAFQTAIDAMERAKGSLAKAATAPDQLPAALSAAQAAYQALLKASPAEYRLSRSKSRGKGAGSASAGEPGREELDQMELQGEENRYETERQASAAATPQQREQSETVDRLKQLARRQQDLNERLRDLQAALQEAPTPKEREEIQRQLKRLRDEERQMLGDVDETRQKLEQSGDPAAQASARQQLEQTRSDIQRAAEKLEKEAVSDALASGARAEEGLQSARENLRKGVSSQFSDQMRQLRGQARELANREGEIARGLGDLSKPGQKTLDDSAPRQALARQLADQQNALTNLLGGMRAVTEQAETAEPLLSKQLYDLIRQTDQARPDNQMELSQRLLERGFLPQAEQAEGTARRQVENLRQGVEKAAERVLGSEAGSLRFAQKELEDLARQLAADAGDPGAAGPGGTNGMARAGGAGRGTNQGPAAARAERSGGERAQAQAAGGGQGGRTNATARAGQPGGGQSPAGADRKPGEGEPGDGSPGSETAANGAPGAGNQPGRTPGQGRGNRSGGTDGGQGEERGQNPGSGAGGDSRGPEGGVDRLTEIARNLGSPQGGGRGGGGINGPITGADFVDWTERMRDVEQALDSPDLRQQLATVRERVGAYRRAFRQSGSRPSGAEMSTQVLGPLARARDWVAQELSRARGEQSLVPLDRDPVQEKYADLVRQYYEKLGGEP